MIRKNQFPEVMQSLWGKSLCFPSYFALSCGGTPISVIRKYIEEQDFPLIRMKAFCKKYNPDRLLLIEEDGIHLEEFLMTPIEKWVSK